MKKCRPAVMLTVLCSEERVIALEEIVFRETRTFGIRRHVVERRKLKRQATTVETPWGSVAGKLGWLEGRPPLFTPEHDSCVAIARKHGIALHEVERAAQRAFEAGAAKSL